MSSSTPRTSSTPTGADRARQVGVTLSAVFCVVGTLFGTGVIGSRVAESSGGALADNATLIAPAGPAFTIWSVVYLGLLAYTVWQWLPAHAASNRHRSIGWLAAASMVLNAAWLLVTQVNWLWVSVGVIVVLALILGLLVQRLVAHPAPAGATAERVIVDGTFGLYLGWVAVATCANIAATLVAGGVAATGTVATVLTLAVLVAVAAIGTMFARVLRGRWAVAIAMAWGLAWIAVGRLTDTPQSVIVGAAAAVAALLIVAATATLGRHRAANPSSRPLAQ